MVYSGRWIFIARALVDNGRLRCINPVGFYYPIDLFTWLIGSMSPLGNATAMINAHQAVLLCITILHKSWSHNLGKKTCDGWQRLLQLWLNNRCHLVLCRYPSNRDFIYKACQMFTEATQLSNGEFWGIKISIASSVWK